MKKLTLPDSFALSRVIKSGNLQPQFEEFANNIIDGKIENDKAIKVFLNIFLSLGDKETEQLVYEFFSGAFEMEIDEIKRLSLGDFGVKLKELAKENNIANFIIGVKNLMK